MRVRDLPLAVRFLILGACFLLPPIVLLKLPLGLSAVWQNVLVGGWLLFFFAYLSFRLETILNIRSIQNRRSTPANPDNYREFKSFRAWARYFFSGRDDQRRGAGQPDLEDTPDEMKVNGKERPWETHL
ncbi:MAG: hypothetical protein K8T91_11905 [Planctomycetes bacterium]|nr:hypothetical protein [Planctomycetota bacterium]